MMPIRGPTPNALFGWPQTQCGRSEHNPICVVGAPTDLGNGIARGTALAAAAIRGASLKCAAPVIGGLDWGDIVDPGRTDLSSFLELLAQTVERIHGCGMQPLILGGDHSITYAPLSALAHFQDLCLVWFDAHTDFSPWCGRGSHDHKQVLRRIYALDRVRRIVQIGHRGITSGDERRLGSKAVVVTSAVARSLRPLDLLSLIPDDLPCYISIDIDVIDPLFAPGTAAPVPDGLSPEVVRALLACIIQSRKVAGVDIVEVNPRLDVQSATVSVAAALVRDIAHRWGSRLAATPSRPDASANAPPSLPPGE